MGSTILPVIALVIFLSSGASALKCYTCVYANGVDLSDRLPDLVTSTCASGTGIPSSFEQNCTAFTLEHTNLHAIRQTINVFNPKIAKSINAILDQLNTEIAKKSKQAPGQEWSCGTADVSMKLSNGDQVFDVTATARSCLPKLAGVSDSSVCGIQTGKDLVDQLKKQFPQNGDQIDDGVKLIINYWTNFLTDNIGVCFCEADLCTKKAPGTVGGGGSGVIEVFASFTIVSALLSVMLSRN